MQYSQCIVLCVAVSERSYTPSSGIWHNTLSDSCTGSVARVSWSATVDC